MTFFWSAVLSVCLVGFLKIFLTVGTEKRILQVYSLPGKWYHLKYFLLTVLIPARKLIAKYTQKRGLSSGYGVQSYGSLQEVDFWVPLSPEPKAFDAVYMNGSNRIGWNLIAGCAVRQKNIDGFLILKVPGIGLLLSPRLPDCVLPRKDGVEDYSSEGLTFTPLVPMKSWHLRYKGKMRLSHKPHKKVEVELDTVWSSDLPCFNYDTQPLAKNITKALSREPWSVEYFKTLEELHQTHYEQFGELTGGLVIDGVDFKLNLNTLRDHSFGKKRDWKAFHRYMLLIFTLADGTCGTVGVVCIPNIFSRMEIGYIYVKEEPVNVVPVYDVDFELYNHGEMGIPPTDFGLTFFAGGKCYEVKVHVDETMELYLGLEWEARVVEGLSRYSINGVDGWGCVEWMYAYPDGRPCKHSSKLINML